MATGNTFRGVGWSTPAAMLSFAVLSLCAAPARAGDPQPQARNEAVLPPNLVIPAVVRPTLISMWRKSPTFRRQCARLIENPGVIVRVELAGRVKQVRARSRLDRHATGLTATVQIDVRHPTLYIEHIAHELEHVLEYVDGTDLPRLARQGLNGVENHAGQYETARARSVGRTVAREAILQ
jgi:hypothetical protein